MGNNNNNKKNNTKNNPQNNPKNDWKNDIEYQKLKWKERWPDKVRRYIRYIVDRFWSTYYFYYMVAYRHDIYLRYLESWAERPHENIIELDLLRDEIEDQTQLLYKYLSRNEIRDLGLKIQQQQFYLYTIILDKNYTEEQIELQETMLYKQLDDSLELKRRRLLVFSEQMRSVRYSQAKKKNY